MSLKTMINRVKVISTYRNLRKYFSEEDSLIILCFMFELTPKGFEEYIGEFLKEIRYYDKVVVTGGIEDEGIDVKGKKGDKYVAIQCKKLISAHITEKDALMFVEQTKYIKKQLGETLDLYFVTTNWINRQAKARLENNGINILYSRDILKMNKKLKIYDFVEKYKDNPEIVTGMVVDYVLDIYYYRKAFGRILGDIMYFIERLLSKIFPFGVDYDKVDKNYPEEEVKQKLLKKPARFDKKEFYG